MEDEDGNSTETNLDPVAEKADSKLFAIHIVLSVAALCIGAAGIIANVAFLRRNKGFLRKKDKLSDIKLLLSLLSIFNIFFLIDALPLAYFSNETMNERTIHLCVIYQYIAHLVKFGVYYFVVAISKECCVLAINNPSYNKSNRFQMLVEAFVVWGLQIILFIILDFTFIYTDWYHECLWSHLIPIRDLFILLFIILSLIFTLATYCLGKQLNESDSLTMHFARQSRKTCFLYFLLWLPEFICVLIYAPPRKYVITYDESSAVFLINNLLELSSAALFPFIWKNQVVLAIEHELM